SRFPSWSFDLAELDAISPGLADVRQAGQAAAHRRDCRGGMTAVCGKHGQTSPTLRRRKGVTDAHDERRASSAKACEAGAKSRLGRGRQAARLGRIIGLSER
ncbi:hypothetical protein NDN91_22865, partial [Burkholderia glumae]